jgi:hypothetical protein
LILVNPGASIVPASSCHGHATSPSPGGCTIHRMDARIALGTSDPSGPPKAAAARRVGRPCIEPAFRRGPAGALLRGPPGWGPDSGTADMPLTWRLPASVAGSRAISG